MKQKKYWEILLEKHREKGKDGLTIPFIIGSQNYLENNSYKQNISELIYDIVSSNLFEVCIRYCITTNTFIAEIRKEKNGCYYPKIDNNEQNKLSVGIYHKTDFGESIKELIEYLIDKFQNPIDNKTYSAEPNTYERTVQWNEFSEKDKIFIKKCFK
ncbi:hypothetical protein [Flavobacterium xanthum]|uniref:Uncharacterized protein n=1 Tax=Flavobacterium xanthum TaxID=69322 RepID=A0A1M7LM78_9FLAO|nr:hypothetical protein [Flavobacterium xanthum]SHM79305.1 hypothetical protein SAMN05443669_10763 [Flavobacterium xanthum]